MAQTRLAVLDALRGIAVLLVLWYHVWEISWLPAPLPALQFIPETGFAGVDLFFFISGFVIVYPFVKAVIHADIEPTWGHFAYRRAIKIVPSYVLSIVVLIAIGYAQFGSAREAAVAIVTHLLFIHTWFSDTYGAINGVLWTLAVEVEFYLVFPLLWFFFKRSPFVTAAALTGLALAFRHYALACCQHTAAGLMIDNLPGYLDTFAFGMISAYVYVRVREHWGTSLQRAAATLTAIAGFVFLFYLLHALWMVRAQPDWSTVWQIDNRTLIAVAFAAISLGSLLAYTFWQRLLANPVLLFFAVISYNLYLYHQALARELLRWGILPVSGKDPHFDPHWQVRYTIVAFVATIVQAAIFTYGFERPLLRVPLEWWQSALARLRARWAPSRM
jgi:peptidoglycan/LPS O-acetylase OafA/YrhL